MSGMGTAHSSVLERFRKQQIQSGKVMEAAAKDRDARLAKIQARKLAKAPAKSAASRKAESASSEPSASARASPSSQSWRSPADGRPAPLGLRQKLVVDFLRRSEAPQSSAEIAAGTGFDPSADPELALALGANQKVISEGDGRFSYRPEVAVRGREQLLGKIRAATIPLSSREAADAYAGALDDVEVLKKRGQVVGLYSHEPEIACEVLFPVDQRLEAMRVDDDVRDLWLATSLPEAEEDLVEAVRQAGMKPAVRRTPKSGQAAERRKKKKPRKQQRIRAVTNVHLMHLLEGEGPTTID